MLLLVVTLLVPIVLLMTGRHVARQRKGASAEIGALMAYIVTVVFFAVAFWDELDRTAVVAGLACVVYAVSLWRRLRA